VIKASERWKELIESNVIYSNINEQKYFNHVSKMYKDDFYKIICKYSNIGGRLLEAGCGMGYCTTALSRAGYQAYGLDISEKIISDLNKIVEHIEKKKNHNFIVGDILKLNE